MNKKQRICMIIGLLLAVEFTWYAIDNRLSALHVILIASLVVAVTAFFIYDLRTRKNKKPYSEN